ncbi:MAG: biotin/lipoyl-binding protein [Cyanobacteria bacterium NC_groundwater_1444_Ag_S-0.65um_54_12]|nr:biotin/lipoyl-binding protein [Cyanobacteria bacterium NC_groundwater_1444_Ag_S-0.65um_54_12]
MSAIKAHMAGTIIDIMVKEGEQVSAGQDVACLESMKMQMFIQSDQSGTVRDIKVTPGDFVAEGSVILELA